MKFASFALMKLADYINDLLYRYDCVIIPNFGGFITNKIGAKFDKTAKVMYPPKKQVTFNAYLQHNDGLLANYIASKEKTSFKKAIEKIAKEVEDCKNQLGTKTVFVANIGALMYNEEKKLLFEPNVETNFLIDSFGLAQTSVTLVNKKEEKVTKMTVSEEKKETKIISLAMKRASVAVVALGIVYVGWNSTQNYDDYQTPPANQQKEVQSATFVVDTPLPTMNLKILEKEKTRNFHIIAGVFQKVDNANNKVNELKEQGFNSKIIGQNSSGLTQVVYESYFTKELACTALKKIKKNVSEDAWLLKK